MPFQPIDSQRLYQKVADQIGELIRAGEFKPGHRLPPERDLSKQLGVSRPVVREAMIALELAGLIEVRTGAGTFVREAANGAEALGDVGHSPYDILSSRMVIEGEIAAIAAREAGPDAVATLSRLVDAMARAGVESDPDLDRQFHVGIADATGSAVLAAVVGWLWQMQYAPVFAILSERVHLAENLEATVQGHRAIVTALEAHDAATAKAAMCEHLAQVRDIITGESLVAAALAAEVQ
ncbi:MAG: FadR/GntR family transcriptional regulator [Ancalomicrobiaceae bacterium]|nr:FadR/GntR family transcriptional regulator [Ancalomicrobiaceae bacterium]